MIHVKYLSYYIIVYLFLCDLGSSYITKSLWGNRITKRNVLNVLNSDPVMFKASQPDCGTINYLSSINETNIRNMSKIPNHVGYIVDGNGRWALQQRLDRSMGHKVGANRTIDIIKSSFNLGVNVITLYLFSTENWKRPAPEIHSIMNLLEYYLTEWSSYMKENQIILKTIGQTHRLYPNVQNLLETSGYKETPTKASKTNDYRHRNQLDRFIEKYNSYPESSSYHGLSSPFPNDLNIESSQKTSKTLCLAISYGGRNDIIEACRDIIKDRIPVSELNEDTFNRYTSTGRLGIPDPDLIIRTSGEFRLSNFLLWQSAYTEFESVTAYWPDFTVEANRDIILKFSERKRRFGGVNELSC